jgi:RNA polymerase sigma factor (sigma-70 family)
MERHDDDHDNRDNAIYQEVEKMVTPILEGNARRFRRQLGMTDEEAMQEARFGLMLALRKYDYNDSRGGFYNFVSIAVRRHFLRTLAGARTQSRQPHLRVVDEAGKRVILRLPFAEPKPLPSGQIRSRTSGQINFDSLPADFMDTIEAPMSAPDASLMEADRERAATAFQAALENALSERDRRVLRCKSDPPRGLRMLMLDELATEPTIPMIGEFLGLSKNEVDWALRRIREAALELIARDFSDLTDSAIVRGYVDRRL